MITRLADVLYWSLSGIAVLIVIGGWQVAHADLSTIFGLAFIVWLIGLGLRYVLSGKGVMP